MQTRGNRVKVYFESPDNMELPPITSSDVINITCGLLHARLHKERFICPGINRDCIEYEGRFITPKTFYVMAEKGSLKDWKNAIRINGKKIRRYIDKGELDFYNHEQMCTGRCKSRMGAKTSLLPFDQTKMKNESSDMYEHVPEHVAVATDDYGEPQDVKPSPDQLNHMLQLNLKPGQNGSDYTPPTTATGVHPVQLIPVGKNLDNEDDEDTMFWRAIVQLGLVDEFFREIKSKLDVLKVSMIKKFVTIEDAKKASLIVNELGMKAKLDMRLCAHKFEFDRQRDKLEKEMEQLKKKVNEYEQKKDLLKRKSDCYEQLMTKKIKYDNIPSTASLESNSSGRSSKYDSVSSTEAVTSNSSRKLVIVNTNYDGASSLNSPGLMVKIEPPPSREMGGGDSRASSPYPSMSQETIIPSSQDTQTGSDDSGDSNISTVTDSS